MHWDTQELLLTSVCLCKYSWPTRHPRRRAAQGALKQLSQQLTVGNKQHPSWKEVSEGKKGDSLRHPDPFSPARPYGREGIPALRWPLGNQHKGGIACTPVAPSASPSRAPWMLLTLEPLHPPHSSQAFPHPSVLTDPVPASQVHWARARCQPKGHWRLQLEVVQTQLQRAEMELS